MFKYTFSKKTSWLLLVAMYIFDDVFSYYAVTHLGGREANLAIAFMVEKYPLLYFLCIPVQTVIVYFIVLGIKKMAVKVLKKWELKGEETIERIILTATVFYWAIGNSFMNLSFLLGHRLSGRSAWKTTSLVGIVTAFLYSFIVLYWVKKSSKSLK